MEAAETPLLPAVDDTNPGFGTLETVFEALGRALVVLDEEFRVIRASRTLDDLGESRVAESIIGQPVEELVGSHLFGPTDSLRETLERGERQEGRRAVLLLGNRSARLVSLTAAPIPYHVSSHCDPRARYIVVLRPAEDDDSLLQSMIASCGLVARSPVMLRIVHLVETLHRSDATVLITGESGTGKEVLARAVHANSPRSGGPFVVATCAALPGELLESELFGHVRGAFTGAIRDRVGRFEAARGGTLFLDEIGDMPLHLQVKLLRVLQEKRYERVGESGSRAVDARIVAATNVDLAKAVREGRFREDLYYRLRVVPIHVPPLRERREDIPLVAQHLLAHIGGRAGRAVRLSPDTLAALGRYDWPGNVRELENALEFAVATCPGQTIQIENLPDEVRGAAGDVSVPPRDTAATAAMAATAIPMAAPGAPEELDATSSSSGEEADAARIRRALEEAHWSRGRAADLLGVSRTTLWRRMRELGIG